MTDDRLATTASRRARPLPRRAAGGRTGRGLAALALAGVALTLPACYVGSGGAADGGTAADGDVAGACPQDLPQSCPSAVPSYANDVAPVLTQRCASCHAPGGVEANRDLTTYDAVFAQRTMILSQVYSCRMPPSGATALSADQRALLLDWLVCGAPGQ